MDLSAIAETTVEMWVLIDAKLTARNQQDIDPMIKSTILREAMSLYMTHIIGAQKAGTPSSDSSEPPRPATEKQLKYLKDLGGDPSKFHSAAEVSKEIDRLKGK